MVHRLGESQIHKHLVGQGGNPGKHSGSLFLTHGHRTPQRSVCSISTPKGSIPTNEHALCPALIPQPAGRVVGREFAGFPLSLLPASPLVPCRQVGGDYISMIGVRHCHFLAGRPTSCPLTKPFRSSRPKRNVAHAHSSEDDGSSPGGEGRASPTITGREAGVFFIWDAIFQLPAEGRRWVENREDSGQKLHKY